MTMYGDVFLLVFGLPIFTFGRVKILSSLVSGKWIGKLMSIPEWHQNKWDIIDKYLMEKKSSKNPIGK